MPPTLIRRVGVYLLASLVLFTYAAHVSADDTAAAPADVVSSPPNDAFDEEFEEQAAGFPDPLEPINRGTLRLNQGLDRWLLDPITRLYGFILPAPVRYSIRRFLSNLNSPSVFVNDLLQCEWKDAGITAARFGINTTAGLAGLFDPATPLGLARHHSDFGQTLALAGVGSGPYLMLPALGPTTVRDGFGFLVDALFRPTTYVLGPGDQIAFTTIHGGSSGIAVRDEHIEEIRVLRESSVDYYAALRNAYYQNRIAEIWNGREHRRKAAGRDSQPTEPAESGLEPPPPQHEPG
jgi:phospholipid-binding lipoprotein MlaA